MSISSISTALITGLLVVLSGACHSTEGPLFVERDAEADSEGDAGGDSDDLPDRDAGGDSDDLPDRDAGGDADAEDGPEPCEDEPGIILTDVLVASDGREGDSFAFSANGTTLSFDGERLLVGAARAEGEGGTLENGAAYVFRRVVSGWVEEAKIVSPVRERNFNFASNVALSGDLAIATTDDAAYIYGRDGCTWTERGSMVWEGGVHSVAMSGDTAAVCVGSLRAGSYVEVFQLTGEGWGPATRLSVSHDGCTEVALEGDTLAVGVRRYAVYVFARAGDTWIEEAVVLDLDAGFEVEAIALSGSTLVVGDPSAGVERRGAAVVFSRVGDEWIREADLVPPDAPSNHYFGWAVDASTDLVVIGAPTSSLSGGVPTSAGRAYVYERRDRVWELTTTLLNQLDGWDNFGYGVAMSGWNVAVSTLRLEGYPRNQGGVYVF